MVGLARTGLKELTNQGGLGFSEVSKTHPDSKYGFENEYNTFRCNIIFHGHSMSVSNK